VALLLERDKQENKAVYRMKPYTLIRSKRKTLALCVDGEGQLVVRAPLKLAERDIEAFIEKKAQWIAARQRRIAEEAARFKVFELVDGESILLFGEPHVVNRGDVTRVTVVDEHILVPLSMTLEGFAGWMRFISKKVIKERVAYYAKLMGVSHSTVKITNAKRRWGSCSAKNTLNFSWRLVMCPRWVIDYVVVHELCHVAFKNHSPQFWEYVATQMPHYKEARNWLRQNQKLMDVI